MNFESLPRPRTYDADLNETEDLTRIERLENLAQDQIEFILDRYPVRESTLMERYALLAAVEWMPGEAYYTEIDDEIMLNKDAMDGGLTRGFVADLVRRDTVRQPAIYYHESLGDFSLSHEIFHALSTSVEDYRSKSTGTIYVKNGLRVATLDRERRLIDDRLRALEPNDSALNEGVTELLARKFQQTQDEPQARTTWDYRKNRTIDKSYHQYTAVADILVAPEHPELVLAYFADDPRAPRKFLDDFGERQEYVFESLLEEMGIPSSEFFDKRKLREGYIHEHLVAGAVQYAMSFYRGERRMAEWQRIRPIAEQIFRNNANICGLSSEESLQYYEYIANLL